MITLASLRWHILFLLLLGAAVLVWWAKTRFFGAGQPAPTSMPLYMAPASDATWPWPGAKTATIAPGVTQSSKVSSDGTMLDLFDFDFGANPRLRWEIFDQDEDDAKPLDNRVEYWNRNVAQMARQLDGAKHRGAVIAAWNGAFFGYDNKTASADAFHVSPVVLRGKVLFNTAQHRWTFGVKNTPDGPVWKTFFKPNRATMEREFDYAAGSVQCLIKDGKPLKVEPFPPVGGAFKAQPVASTDKEAGHIPYFDHMKTCRASIGWSRDNKHLYFLAVKEPDGEGASSVALSFAVRGQHVLCEKPLALTLVEAREMVAACRQAGVVLGTNHHLRNAATHRTFRRLIAEGAIGRPLAARVFHAVFLPPHLQGWRIDRPEAGGGVVLDITVHDADTLRFILDDEVATVTAMTANQGMATRALEDTVMGVMQFRNGALAQFHDAFTIRHAHTGFEIHGSDGSLYGVDVMTQAPRGTITLRRGDREEIIDVGPHESLYERSVRRFNAAVRGDGEPAATGDDGVRSLAIALAAREAAATGCVVAVDDE